MNKKIGLCVAFTGTNYGQNLQAFATQQVIDRYGFVTEILDYHSGKNKGIELSFGAIYVATKKMKALVTSKLKPQKPIQYDDIHLQNIRQRREAAQCFKETYLHGVVKCNGITELKEKSKEYAAVLVGSDQLWLPDVAVTNFYTLRFAVPGVRRISYATSMGVSAYPNYVKKSAADFWKKIDYLSVREEQAKRVIQEICDVPVEVVTDPTYLLTKEEWLERIPLEMITKDGYVLCYFLGDSHSIKNYARRFADEKGLRVVSILSNECNSDDSSYADEVIIGKGPDGFINLIRNANYVLTDSFHGVAFSIINEKPFYVFYRRRPDVKESRNSRIDNIVRIWGVEDRLIKEPETAPITDSYIDYAVVNEKREKYKEKSLHFLETALGVK